MSSLQNVSPEVLAKLFHHYTEALANDFDDQKSDDQRNDDRKNREATLSWEQASQNERKLMVAAARLTLLELDAISDDQQANRRYFAKPGEAEWGC
jgi:hypothetical protein